MSLLDPLRTVTTGRFPVPEIACSKALVIGPAGQPGGRSARPLSRRRGELELTAVTEEIGRLCCHRLHD
jgi:hypothetical protein